ncbi:hypothetical protein BHE74_00038971 [Ensete ventricosum]|nr:hypothetical protein GW17_00061368 [Ensete ventricosum]RWW54449.1 hypothetical protein BHE74_00038971 [Ensete ventricosum]
MRDTPDGFKKYIGLGVGTHRWNEAWVDGCVTAKSTYLGRVISILVQLDDIVEHETWSVTGHLMTICFLQGLYIWGHLVAAGRAACEVEKAVCGRQGQSTGSGQDASRRMKGCSGVV